MNETTTTEIATTNATPELGYGEMIKSPKGNVTGERFLFHSKGMKMKDAKDMLRARGYKGRELSRKAREVYSSEQGRLAIAGTMFQEMCRDRGFVPDFGEVRKNSATLKFAQVGEPESELRRMQRENEELKKKLEELLAK